MGRGWVWGWVWVPVVSFVLVVAVAMACAVWSPERVDNTFNPVGTFAQNGITRSLRGHNDNYQLGKETTGFGMSIVPILAHEEFPEAGKMFRRVRLVAVGRSGFPFLCMRWTNEDVLRAGELLTMRGGFETPWSVGPNWSRLRRRIPLVPEPVGMALNVLIYSATIVMVRSAWRRAVVFRRRRRGLCVGCAYPIEPSVGACPECGEGYAGAVREEASHG
jgi:hypothetical protein